MRKLESRAEQVDYEKWASEQTEPSRKWVQSRTADWHASWRVDPGIIPHDSFLKLSEIATALRILKPSAEQHEKLRVATNHLLKMCFMDGRSPALIRSTADGGIVFYFFADPADRSVYGCLEIFDDGEIVAAYSDGTCDDAWDLGTSPDAKTVAAALEKIDAFISPTR